MKIESLQESLLSNAAQFEKEGDNIAARAYRQLAAQVCDCGVCDHCDAREKRSYCFQEAHTGRHCNNG